jgi:hypothetical protein
MGLAARCGKNPLRLFSGMPIFDCLPVLVVTEEYYAPLANRSRVLMT